MRLKIFIILINLCVSLELSAQRPDTTQLKRSTITELLDSIQQLSLNSQQKAMDDPNQYEVDQLIINETVSKPGNTFYEIFYSNWDWPEQIKDPFIIILRDRPVFGNNAQIEITVNEMKVFEGFLQPRYEALEEMVFETIAVTTQYILNYHELLKQLGGDDMSGTGVY